MQKADTVQAVLPINHSTTIAFRRTALGRVKINVSFYGLLRLKLFFLLRSHPNEIFFSYVLVSTWCWQDMKSNVNVQVMTEKLYVYTNGLLFISTHPHQSLHIHHFCKCSADSQTFCFIRAKHHTYTMVVFLCLKAYQVVSCQTSFLLFWFFFGGGGCLSYFCFWQIACRFEIDIKLWHHLDKVF